MKLRILRESQPVIDVDTRLTITISDNDTSIEILGLTAETDLEQSKSPHTTTPVIPQTRHVSE